MWHASITRPGYTEPPPPERLLQPAYQALAGVGDPDAGEWLEQRENILHLRRRLTPQESKRTGPPRDIRGTPEAELRRQTASRIAGQELPMI